MLMYQPIVYGRYTTLFIARYIYLPRLICQARDALSLADELLLWLVSSAGYEASVPLDGSRLCCIPAPRMPLFFSVRVPALVPHVPAVSFERDACQLQFDIVPTSRPKFAQPRSRPGE